METRTITQIKIWKLTLNPMRANTESGNLVAIAYSKQDLIDYMKAEKAEEQYYTINDNYFSAKGDMSPNKIKGQKFHKVFKQGGKLEWYNPPFDIENCNAKDNSYGHGISWEWITEKALQKYIENCKTSMGFEVVPEIISKNVKELV